MDEMSFKIYKASDKKITLFSWKLGGEKKISIQLHHSQKHQMLSELLGAEQLLTSSIPNAPNQFCVCNKFNTS